jgi:cell division protein FtsZ
VQGIADIILTPGIINRDFSDIRTIMLGMGYAMMGTAVGNGENASIEAARKAINSPLMEEGGILGARGVLINITAASTLSIHDVNEACNLIRAATHNDDVQINFGVVMDETMGDAVKITVIGTGFQRDSLPEIHRASSTSAGFEANGLPSHESEQENAVVARDGEQAPPPDDSTNDVETPAYLRKKRQMVQ